MICGNCCKSIKLKCFFYLQIITSNTICKKQEQMTHFQQTYQLTHNVNSSFTDEDNDYGHFYDTETNTYNKTESKSTTLHDYNNTYNNYLETYEQEKNYKNKQNNLLIDTHKSFYTKIMEKGVIIYLLQYIFSLCNLNN